VPLGWGEAVWGSGEGVECVYVCVWGGWLQEFSTCLAGTGLFMSGHFLVRLVLSGPWPERRFSSFVSEPIALSSTLWDAEGEGKPRELMPHSPSGLSAFFRSHLKPFLQH
jgi:hypothetical protein